MVRVLEVAEMNPLHLCWIIPGGVAVGMLLAALLRANEEDDDDE
jgi:hypothetical protein